MFPLNEKNIEVKAIYVRFELSVQKGHNKYTVAPTETYRLQRFVLNFG